MKTAFNMGTPAGTAVIVKTPEFHNGRPTCGSFTESEAWIERGQAVVWVKGFRYPQPIDRLTPLGEVVA